VKSPVDRWTEPAGGDRRRSSDEDLAGNLLRDARAGEPLSPEAMNRIEARLLDSRPRAAMQRLPRARFALLAGLLLAGGGVAGAGITLVATEKRTPSEMTAETVMVPSVPKRRKAARISPAGESREPVPAAEGLEPAPTVRPESATMAPAPAPEPRSRRDRERPVRLLSAEDKPARTELALTPPPAPATLEPSALPAMEPAPGTLEARLLGTIVRKLRIERDAIGALALLDRYVTQFPNGALSGEATLARVEALRALDRAPDALALLDAADLKRLPRGRELRVLRGELRVATGRCQQAIADFDEALAGGIDGALAERALYGRAACRSTLLDAAGARADLDMYLTRFPAGPRAAEIRRALDQ
jgi:hypothetical protein